VSKEVEIRQNLIDKYLDEAGWSREKGNLVTEQFLQSSGTTVREQAAQYSPFADSSVPEASSSGRRFADYILLGHRSSNQAAFERALERARTCKL
jgi:type I site-specific restriction endonuclease